MKMFWFHSDFSIGQQLPSNPDKQLQIGRAQQEASRKRIQALRTELDTAQARLDKIVAQIQEQVPDFALSYNAPTLTWGEIRALAPKRDNAALLHLVLSDEGTFVFITTHQSKAPQVIQIKSLTRTSVMNVLNEWLRDYQSSNKFASQLYNTYGHSRESFSAFQERLKRKWQDRISQTLNWLAGSLWIHVTPALKAKNITELIIFPHSYYSLLPLHATLDMLDTYTISYTPAATILKRCQERVSQRDRQGSHTLIVANPTDDLPYTSVEVGGVIKFAPNHTQLSRAMATKENLLEAAHQANIFHFAGHGSYEWDNPLESILHLADGSLTLTEIQSKMDLRCCRLVVLSACETGIIDPNDIQNEYFGLPAGFLMAGTPAIASSLWAVDDLSTALLIKRFYYYHLKEKLLPALALRRAQLWLRDMTLAEFEQQNVEVRDNAPSLYITLERIHRELLKQHNGDANARPFAHPYYWAAFTMTGI